MALDRKMLRVGLLGGMSSAVIDRLGAAGAEAVLLGCTEIDLLIGPEDSSLPTFDTTRLHVQAAVDLALGADRRP